MARQPKPFGGAIHFDATMKSGVDLTANMMRALEIWASQTVTAGTGTANTVSSYIIGLQGPEIPDSGTGVDIRVILGGITQARAGGAFTAGALLCPQTNSSKLIAATSATASRVVARSLTPAAADSDVVSVLVIPSGILL